jgi:hypothetical protein
MIFSLQMVRRKKNPLEYFIFFYPKRIKLMGVVAVVAVALMDGEQKILV